MRLALAETHWVVYCGVIVGANRSNHAGLKLAVRLASALLVLLFCVVLQHFLPSGASGVGNGPVCRSYAPDVSCGSMNVAAESRVIEVECEEESPSVFRSLGAPSDFARRLVSCESAKSCFSPRELLAELSRLQI
jgi:hypothetical protein